MRPGANNVWVRGLLVACLLAASCGKGEGPGLGDGRVVVGLLSEPKSLNPLFASSTQSQDIVNLMFLKLMVEEADFLSFKPSLAERWSFSRDSLSVTFQLREDVFWHDGKPVTATDARFTWQLQIDPRVAWSNRSLKDRITDVEVVGDHTVTFHFSGRYPYQLHDANDGVVVPSHLLATVPPESLRASAFGRNPIGNGPYKFGRWIPGQYIELQRNTNYYAKDRPRLQRVGFRIVPDMTSLVTQLKAGEIDCLESIPLDALPDLQKDYPDIRIYEYMSRGMVFVVWNLESELFEDREVRRALAMAIDAREIIDTLWRGKAAISDSPMHPVLWAHDPRMAPIAYDPERARAALAQAGWFDSNNDGIVDKNGRRFEFEMTTNQGMQVRADVMTMVQEYLRRVGVKVNTRVLEWGAFMDGVVKGDFASCVLGWKVGTRADLYSFWHSTATPPAGFNAGRYRNPRVDALIEQARNTQELGRAGALWHECQRLIYDDQPIFFLAVPNEVVALRAKFCGVEPNAHGFFVNLTDWWVGECP
jgi:peptide/nickel transport system substrate-binding protein